MPTLTFAPSKWPLRIRRRVHGGARTWSEARCPSGGGVSRSYAHIPLLVEHFRVRCNREDQLAVDGFTRQALAVLEADPWPGNVRELERVVYRAMAVRRRGVVKPEEVRLPSLRRSPAVPAATARVAVPVTAATLNRYEVEALRLAAAGGGVRRGPLCAEAL